MNKIKNINIVLPILVTIITAILSYLFTAKINADNLKSAVCITICALVVFAMYMIMFLLFLRFAPKETLVVLLTPILFALKILMEHLDINLYLKKLKE